MILILDIRDQPYVQIRSSQVADSEYLCAVVLAKRVSRHDRFYKILNLSATYYSAYKNIAS